MYLNAIEKGRAPSQEETYLNEIPAIRQLSTLTFSKPVTFFIGENGSGKSTLLEAIAAAFGFNPEGGSRNFRFSTADTHSGLYRLFSLHKGPYRPRDGFFLRAESFYNTATEVDRLSRLLPDDSPDPKYFELYGGKSLHKQSHGESFLSLVLHRFFGHGIYLLDEPEAALSPSRQLTLLTQIHCLVKEDSQFLIATHSPILMAYPESELLLLDEKGIHSVSYRETEHYQITKSFLDNPGRMLRILLEEEKE